jgi:hypothetical protein
MKISHLTIEYLTGIITGDSNISEYRSGPQLVNFFNSLGEQDTYRQGFPSRASYTQSKLENFNNTQKMKQAIEYCFHPLHFIKEPDKGETLLQEINKYLKYDGLKLVKTKTSVKLMNLEDEVSPFTDEENKIFKKGTFGLFISHRDSFKRTANIIKKSLRLYGISSFVAHEDIEPSEEWIKEIEKALFSMDALLALLSDGFLESVWTNQEVGVAFGRGKFILSVRFGEDPQGFVGKFQALRAKKNNVDKLCSQITTHLLNHPKTQEKMIASYFSAIRNAASFAETETWAELLKNITSVSEEAVNILVESYNTNSQAYDCFVLKGGRYGTMEKISDKINKWLGVEKYKMVNNKIKVIP